MNTLRTIIATALLATLGTACDTDTVDGSAEEHTIEVRPGDTWGPCPTDMSSKTPTLCDSEMDACVPADGGDANVCLPLDGCPDDAPFISVEIGWGGACYPRCEVDEDCPTGMVCGLSLADDTPMCAWPV